MVETSQFTFTLKEVAELLVKERNIKTGKWMLAVEFGVGIGNFADPVSSARPGAMVTVGGLLLTKMAEPLPPGPAPDFVIDAATLWAD